MIREILWFLRTPSPQRDAAAGLLSIAAILILVAIVLWIAWPTYR